MRYVAMILLLAGLIGCHRHEDHSKDPWLQHVPTFYRTTPKGHIRDGGPFESIQKDYLTEDVLDQAVDSAFDAFATAFPELVPINPPVTLNDDYVMWIPQAHSWASGVEYTEDGKIGVCIWHRVETASDPGDAFIVRPPGNYFGVHYDVWRHTGFPLVPAIPHELLHIYIGDPNHTSPMWSRVP